MASIWGSDIDNLFIEIDGPEVPIMDGSSKPFVFMIDCAGIKVQNVKRKILKINREVEVFNSDTGSVNYVYPSESFQIDVDIEFSSKIIGRQQISCGDKSQFDSEIASARTFGFIDELEFLQQKGLAKGASLDNSIGLEGDKILNHDGLRYEDEFVRHKLLDAVGDFATASRNIVGHFSCKKPGHNINNELLRKVFDNPNNYTWIV